MITKSNHQSDLLSPIAVPSLHRALPARPVPSGSREPPPQHLSPQAGERPPQRPHRPVPSSASPPLTGKAPQPLIPPPHPRTARIPSTPQPRTPRAPTAAALRGASRPSPARFSVRLRCRRRVAAGSSRPPAPAAAPRYGVACGDGAGLAGPLPAARGRRWAGSARVWGEGTRARGARSSQGSQGRWL